MRYGLRPSTLCLVIIGALGSSPCANLHAQSPQPDDAIVAALASHEYDLATSGREFLLTEARSNNFFLLGELHGDNEIPGLIRRVWPEMWQAGYRHVAAEVSPWIAHQLEVAPSGGAPAIEGLWTRKQASDVRAFAAADANVIWGCDMEEVHPEYLIREWAAMNPADPSLKRMVEITKDGYKRAMAAELATLARESKAEKDETVNFVPLRESIVATLEIEANRAGAGTKMKAQNERELLMKTQFLEHFRAAGPDAGKVLLRFGRNHLHRGYDARGISTLGNFVAEFAVSRGENVFNVGAFGAGGKATLMSETFSMDERGDEPAFALLASQAKYTATVFDLRPLRPLLHAIPAEKRTALDSNLIYWSDAYDALICYKNVTPLKE
jgi:hypothetical protein